MSSKLTDSLKVKAYVLFVYHRFKTSGQKAHARVYLKRVPEDIQRMENVRGKLHREAINYLVSKGMQEKEAIKLLEDECEKGIKSIGKDLVDGRLSCGYCKVKVENWEEHQNSELHQLIADEVYFIHKLWRRVQAQQMMDEMTLGEQVDLLSSSPNINKEKQDGK